MARAHVILCHSSIDHLLDVFRYLYRQEDIFILNIDAKASNDLKYTARMLSVEFDNVYFLDPSQCSWGGYSLVDVTLKSMQKALSVNKEWKHFAILSENHVPLRSPEAIDAALTNNVSYFVTYSMEEFKGEGYQDLEQRFERQFKELPGVGCFPCGDRTSVVSPAEVYHAPQWTVLARSACERILDIYSLRLQDIFKASLLPDEMAIPTAFMQAGDLAREDRGTTYVAYPHLTDNSDQIVSDACFANAVASDMLYARKRPKVLTAAMSARLEPMAQFTDAELRTRLRRRHHIEGNAETIGRLRQHTGRSEIIFDPVHGQYVAATYVAVATPLYPSNYRTYVISEDTINFKICSCFISLSDVCKSLIEADGYGTTMLRVRLNDLHSWHEVHLNSNKKSDFFEIHCDSDFATMVRSLEYHINYAENLHRRASC